MIWLLRHGTAEPGDGDDAKRALTEKGRTQAEAAGAALERLGAGIETCLTSPKTRALETARIACAPLGVDPEVTDVLRGGDFDLEGVAAGRGEVLLVGHEPDFSRAVQLATGARAKLSKGGIAVVDGPALVALLGPQHLRLIAP